MINKLTTEQLQQLTNLKQTGQYRRAREPNYTRTHRETLWLVLQQYLIMRGAHQFKARHFRKKERQGNMYMRPAMFADCPLSPGEIIHVLKYGEKQGLLMREGAKRNLRWFLTKKGLKDNKERMHNEETEPGDKELPSLR